MYVYIVYSFGTLLQLCNIFRISHGSYITYVILCFVYSWEEDPFAAAICLVFELARTLYIDGRLANIEWFEL